MKKIRVFTSNEQISNLVDIIAHLLNCVKDGDGWEKELRYMDYTFTHDNYVKFSLKLVFDSSITIVKL